MAIDTAAKRKSISGIALPFLAPGITPDATPDQAWRQAAGWSYTGILADALSFLAALFGDDPLTSEFWNNYAAITPHDTTDGPFDDPFDAIYVGGSGNVVVVREDNVGVTFAGVSAGIILRVRGIRVNATNTTATSLIGLKRERRSPSA